MKKLCFIFSLLIMFTNCYGQGVTEAQAKEVMGKHFISSLEAKAIYPDLVNEIPITFSLEILKFNHHAWLVPLKVNEGFKYFLVKAKFENEVSTKAFLNQNDTLFLNEAKQAVQLISTLRPFSWERNESEIAYKYFFRTKSPASASQGSDYRKILAYNDNRFLIIDWPNSVEIGVVNKDYISYLTRDKRGREIKLCLAPLPINHPEIEYLQSIYVLTMFYQKN